MARRLIAFVIDLIILSIPVILGGLFMLATTIATLGIAAIFFALLSPLFWPLIVIWAICYYGFTFGSPASATIGMRVMDLEMRTWYGAPAYFVLGCVHAIAVLADRLVPHAVRPAGRLLQRAPTPAARHPAWNGCHQQSGARGGVAPPCAGRALIAKIRHLTESLLRAILQRPDRTNLPG